MPSRVDPAAALSVRFPHHVCSGYVQVMVRKLADGATADGSITPRKSSLQPRTSITAGAISTMRERSQTVSVAVLAGVAMPDSPTAMHSNSLSFDGTGTPQKSPLLQRLGSAAAGSDAGALASTCTAKPFECSAVLQAPLTWCVACSGCGAWMISLLLQVHNDKHMSVACFAVLLLEVMNAA